MSRLNRLTGRFPVFASTAKLGSLQSTTGSVVTNEYPSFFINDRLGYTNGFKKEPTKEQLNGLFNFITEAVSDIHTNGVPPFTLNIAYPKGAVVSFNGNLYVSTTDNNTTHISQKHAWSKVLTETTDTKVTDSNPIGTILTVPKTAKKEGYIDFIEGKQFNQTMYPELYQALGSNTFGSLGSTGYSDLPIGTIIHVLDGEINIPEGFIEWSGFVSLIQYPELKEHLMKMVQRMTDTTSQVEWMSALQVNRLPYYSDFYLAQGESGSMKEDTIRQEQLYSFPVVVDSSNTLNPLGIKRCHVNKETYPVVASRNVQVAQADAPFVLSGLSLDVVATEVSKKQFTVVVGDGEVTRPKTLSTKVLVKAVRNQPSAISSTHKQIIRAF